MTTTTLIEELKEGHVRHGDDEQAWCGECEQEWPCPSIRAAEELERLTGALARVNAWNYRHPNAERTHEEWTELDDILASVGLGPAEALSTTRDDRGERDDG